MNILLTGGAGYIGSHAAISLSLAGHRVIIIDNLVNGSSSAISMVSKIVDKKVDFIHGDIRDASLLTNLFLKYKIGAVVHFAGLKSVSDSEFNPLEYYENNVGGTLSLLKAMQDAKITKILFSSSATVYGRTKKMPLTEKSPTSPISVYGKTKLLIEEIIFDIAKTNPSWSAICLRYFNPVGAHESGMIGEMIGSKGPSNLMPAIAMVASERLRELPIFGCDFPTKDGTGIRDFIHVMDLAEGHVAALQFLLKSSGVFVLNLGTGKPHSVMDVVHEFERVSGRKINCKISERRAGDIPISYADASLASQLIGWKAKRGLGLMCLDAWNWEQGEFKDG